MSRAKTMMLVLLVTPQMKPIPASVKTLEDWGHITIKVHDDKQSKQFVNGNHMMVEATAEDIKTWLQPFDGVWLGRGTPAEQSFEVVHIKE